MKKLKKLKKKFIDNLSDAQMKIWEFSEDHPFLFGHFYACVVIYWALIIYGLLHPGKVMKWVDK